MARPSNASSWLALTPVLLLLAALMAPPPGYAQQDSTFRDVIDVEIVNLDVYVTDKKGRPVTGLGHGDFRLFADGEPVEITNFYAVAGGRKVGAMPGKRQAASPAADSNTVWGVEPRFLVVYLDQLHLGQFTRNRLLEELRPFLKKRHAAGDQIMLVTFDGKVDLRQGFTSDWDLVKASLDQVEAEPGLGHLSQTAHQRVLEEILLISDMHKEMRGPSRAQMPRTQCPLEIGALAKRYAEQIQGQVQSSIASLGTFVDTLAALPGKKALLHVSDGLPMTPGAEVFEFLFEHCGDAGAENTEVDPFDANGALAEDVPNNQAFNNDTEYTQLGDAYQPQEAQLDATKFHVVDLFDDLTSQANASRVTFFTFEAYGPRNFSASDASIGRRRTVSRRVDEVRRGSLQDSLTVMAERTGGRAVLDTTKFDDALARLGDDLDTYYSLGYRLPKSKGGKTVTVRVELDRPDARLRYRKTLRSRSLAEDLAGRTQSALVYGLSENPLDISVRPGSSLPMDDGLHMVPIQVRIPIGKITLVPENGEHHGKLTLYFSGRDRAGKVTPVRTAAIPIRIPAAQLEVAKTKVYLYEVRMLMRPGDHTVAVGIHDDVASVSSFTTGEVAVAEAPGPGAMPGS